MLRIAIITLSLLSSVMVSSLACFADAKEDCRDFTIKQLVVNTQSAFPNWQNDPAERAKAIQSVVDNVFNAENNRGCQAIMIADANRGALDRQSYAAAFDQLRKVTQNLLQTGGNASNSGTTNLVSKNLAPYLLGIASEYGGMTQSTSGQTTTFSGTLSGVPLTIESKTGAPLFAPCSAGLAGSCTSEAALDALSRFAYSVAVSTSGTAAGTGTAGTGTGNAQPVTLSNSGSNSSYTLTQATLKVAILRQYPTKDELKQAADKIDATILKKIQDAAKQLTINLSQIDNPPAAAPNAALIRTELRSAAEALLTGYPSQPGEAWDIATAHLTNAAKLGESNFSKDVADYLQAIAPYAAQEDLVFEGTRKPTVSFEYDLNRPANQPSNSNFKLVGSWNKDPWTFTLNATASIYNSQPSSSIPSASRLRSLQIAAETDYKVSKSIWVLGNPTLTGAFYYQNQTSPSILNVPIQGLPITGLSSSTTQVFTQRGPIDIGQFKISFGSSTSGFRVPLSLTISNRTELLTGMDVRGQVGISYNFDALLPK